MTLQPGISRPAPRVEPTPARPPLAVPPLALGPLRPFRREDIPAVATLRQIAFRHSGHRTTAELIAYITRVFFEHPWQDVPLRSWVHLDAEGAVNGFVGMVPRRVRFRGRRLTMGVPTQLMVRPGTPPGAGVRLVRAVIDGPQDFTFSDAANEAARRIWTRVGGRTSIVPSLFWTLPIRPTRFALGRWGRSLPARAASLLVRPFIGRRDRDAPELPAARGVNVVTETLEPACHLGAIEQLLGGWSLAPMYDLKGFSWLIADASAQPERGPLVGRFVRDTHGAPVGWFLFHANEGGVGEVVQLGARPGEQARVLAPLVAEAHRRGVVALRGRLEAGVLEMLEGTAATFTRNGPWTLTYARDPELMAEITEATGFLTRLDAEWSLNF